MKTVLFATDYTEHSVSALQYAYDLSQRLDVELVVLHVFDIPSFPGTINLTPLRQTQKRAYEEQRSLLHSYCQKHLGADYKKSNVRTEVLKHLSIVEGIQEIQERISADLIIIGIKDKYSQRGLLEGDIAKTLITDASCPLLVIPNHCDAKQINTMVYATDFEEADIFAIEKLAYLAAPFKAEIRVIHIASKHTEDKKNQMEWFKELVQQKVAYENIVFDILISDDVFEELNVYLKNTSADMVSLLEREERGIFKKLFHEDLVKKVESHTSIPLLSFSE